MKVSGSGRHRRERAIELMLTGISYTEIAKQLGLNVMTIYRWLDDPEFARQLEQAREDMRAEFRQRCAAMIRAAQDRLWTLLASEDERVAMQAIRDVLDRAGATAEAAAPVKSAATLTDEELEAAKVEAAKVLLSAGEKSDGGEEQRSTDADAAD